MCTCDVDFSGVTVLPVVTGDNDPVVDVGGLLGAPVNTSSSFCVNCANPCVAKETNNKAANVLTVNALCNIIM